MKLTFCGQRSFESDWDSLVDALKVDLIVFEVGSCLFVVNESVRGHVSWEGIREHALLSLYLSLLSPRLVFPV